MLTESFSLLRLSRTMKNGKKYMVSKSYSAYQSHKKCGLQYKLKYVERVPAVEVKSSAAQRGTDKHSLMEQFVKGDIDVLPPDMSQYSDFLKHLMKQAVKDPEHQWSFNKKWEPVPWSGAAYRGIIDLRVKTNEGTPHIYEWKTGKIYDDHPEQRMLYGMVELLESPDADKVLVYGVYLDLGETRRTEYSRTMLENYKHIWDQRFDVMDEPMSWFPNPGYYCRWCSYANSNGGPCKFG